MTRGHQVMNLDGSRPVRLGAWNVFVMRADGSGVRQVTHGGVELGIPDWSLGDSRILFTAARGGPSAISVVKTDGSGRRIL